MNNHCPMEFGSNLCETDHGPRPFIANITCTASQNQYYRTALWTGDNLQMTLMSIPPCGETGAEIHRDMDQLIRVEKGQALVSMGESREDMDSFCNLNRGDAVFIPEGTWHNISNTGNCPLKLSSVYAPTHHPRGTIHCTKADAENEEY